MSIDERLTRLERGVRWWRRLAFLLFAAIGGMLLTGQAKWSEAQNLSVRSLRITDKSGIVRVAFTHAGDSEQSMLLNDDKGRRRVRLGLTHGGAPRLSMYDRDGVARAALTLDPDGIPNLELRGHKGQSRASIGVSVDGGAYVTLTDRKRPRLSITVTEFATGVYVWDKDLTLRTAVGIGPIRGESSEQMNALTLYGPKGAVIWQAPK